MLSELSVKLRLRIPSKISEKDMQPRRRWQNSAEKMNSEVGQVQQFPVLRTGSMKSSGKGTKNVDSCLRPLRRGGSRADGRNDVFPSKRNDAMRYRCPMAFEDVL